MTTRDRQASPLWDQLTLFGPKATRPDRARPVQLLLDDPEGNVAMVEAARAIARMRRGPTLKALLRRRYIPPDISQTFLLKLFWMMSPEARAEVLRGRKKK